MCWRDGEDGKTTKQTNKQTKTPPSSLPQLLLLLLLFWPCLHHVEVPGPGIKSAAVTTMPGP